MSRDVCTYSPELLPGQLSSTPWATRIGYKGTKGGISPVGYAYSFPSTCKPFPNGLMCLGNGLCPAPLSRFAPCYVKVYTVRKRHRAAADGGDTSSLQCPIHLPSGWEARTAAVLCDNPVQSMDMSLNGPYCQAQMQPGSAVSGCA